METKMFKLGTKTWHENILLNAMLSFLTVTEVVIILLLQ